MKVGLVRVLGHVEIFGDSKSFNRSGEWVRQIIWNISLPPTIWPGAHPNYRTVPTFAVVNLSGEKFYILRVFHQARHLIRASFSLLFFIVKWSFLRSPDSQTIDLASSHNSPLEQNQELFEKENMSRFSLRTMWKLWCWGSCRSRVSSLTMMLSSIINLISFMSCLPSHSTCRLRAERSQLEKNLDYSEVFVYLLAAEYNFRRIKRWNNVWAARLNCLGFFMAADYIRRCLRCSRLMRSDWLSWDAKQKKNNFHDTKLFYPRAAKCCRF